MKYFQVDFSIGGVEAAAMQDVRDVLTALAGQAGFESFEDTEAGVRGYVQCDLFDAPQLDVILSECPFADADIAYEVVEADYRDWNQQWEAEGFEPIVVNHRCVIHDGRHLPPSPLTPHPDAISIEIDAHMAFGTGNHATTRMMADALLGLDLRGKSVLDCGCGTGILAIAALKAGAAHAVGYDIDEWSADNARHNAVINGVDSRFVPLLGDATVLDAVETRFDVVVANINRNVLLADMPRMVAHMATPRGRLLLSGFFEDDAPLLTSRAAELGLRLEGQRHDGEWCCLQFVGA